jgi:hypothetical protein
VAAFEILHALAQWGWSIADLLIIPKVELNFFFPSSVVCRKHWLLDRGSTPSAPCFEQRVLHKMDYAIQWLG